MTGAEESFGEELFLSPLKIGRGLKILRRVDEQDTGRDVCGTSA